MILKSLLLLAVLCSATSIVAQDKAPVSLLIDSLVKQTSEERSLKFDLFVNQLNNLRNSKGYVFVYCGKLCRYGEVESHFRGIEMKLARRGFDRSRIFVVHGGYRDVQSVELWVQPEGACAAVASPSISVKDVIFTKVTRNTLEPYDCCDHMGPR